MAGMKQVDSVTHASSYTSASDQRGIIGIGSAAKRVIIRSAIGVVQKFSDMRADEFLHVPEPHR